MTWRPADGLILEPNALRAAKEIKHSLALTAGPGAGKTEMLAQRADFLLRTNSCPYPRRILAISFKVDASANLKQRVRRRCGTDLSSRFDSYTFHAFAKRIIDRFRPVLTGRDALDVDYQIGDRLVPRRQIEFGDLVRLATQILQTSNIARNAVRCTYSDVFLDEFQDCTDQQYALLKVAFQGTDTRLTAVGDTKQKIMGWAGALDGIFLTFANDFSAKPLNMYRNFRSRPRLLRMQNDIIRVMDPTSVMPKRQLIGQQGIIDIQRFNNDIAESEFLADAIEGWIEGESVPSADIAVLVSKQAELYAERLMEKLALRGIPYRNEQQIQDISTEPAARLIVDYLLCLYGKREPQAWTRLANLLNPYADDEDQASARQNLQRLIAEQRGRVGEDENANQSVPAWWQFVRAFLRAIGINALVALSHDYESRARLNEVIRDTKARIEELLKLETDLPKALKRFSGDQAVRILTIHKSKGLEFDSVVVLGVERQAFWGNVDAERCAYFVGISRAKRRLLLTVCDWRETPRAATRRWDNRRTEHEEFIGYALPHLGAPRSRKRRAI